MIRNDEDFFGAVERISGPLTVEDRQGLLAILSSPAFLRAARDILLGTDELKNRFLAFNLGDEKDRAAASKLQGEVSAYPRIFGLLVDLALKKEDSDVQTSVS